MELRKWLLGKGRGSFKVGLKDKTMMIQGVCLRQGSSEKRKTMQVLLNMESIVTSGSSPGP